MQDHNLLQLHEVSQRQKVHNSKIEFRVPRMKNKEQISWNFMTEFQPRPKSIL